MEAGKTQEAKSEDTIYTFIEKYRMFFFVLLAVIAAGLLGSVAFFYHS